MGPSRQSHLIAAWKGALTPAFGTRSGGLVLPKPKRQTGVMEYKYVLPREVE